MVDTTGNTDTASVTDVPINPESNNPIEVQQTSTLQTTDTGGVGEDGFEVSANLTGANVAEQVNIVVVIDQSGSTRNDSGTDFTGDGVNETILEAELIAAQTLFDEYIAAGYDPSEVTVSLVTYDTTAESRGSFDLSEGDAFANALNDIANEGPGGFTNYQAGLNAAGDALDDAGADPNGTNVVAFLSDGFPIPSGQDIEGAAEDLEDDWNATISGIGIGANSSLDALNLLDNTADGAEQVLSGQDLVDVIVEPLTDADFLRFEIVIEGVDANGDPFTQTIVLPEDDPNVITTQLGWSIDCLPIDPDNNFPSPQDITVTVNGIFAEDPGDPGSGEQVVTTQHAIPLVVCFTLGTRILTPDGEVAIEELEAGDRVVTRDHGVQRIRWIGATTLPAGYVRSNPHLRPILIRQGALGEGVPQADLRVSRQHRILVRDWRSEVMFGDANGVLTAAFTLCNDSTIVQERPDGPVTYIHMAFDQHEVVYAEGVEAESFHVGAETLAGLSEPQRAELLELFPQLETGSDYAYGAARKELRGAEGRILASGSGG